MKTGFAVQLTAADGEIIVSCRDLPEVVTSGASEAEALEMAKDAIDVVVSAAIDRGLSVSEPSAAREGEHIVNLPA